jgi:hypothetical protein
MPMILNQIRSTYSVYGEVVDNEPRADQRENVDAPGGESLGG